MAVHDTSSITVLKSLWIPRSYPALNGSSSMVSFENGCGAQTDCDDEHLRPGKKRRLSGDQVQFLEKSFEAEQRLEPERKDQIAKELDLNPRQVAIWFQNRRARSKTKRLEIDYESLRSSFVKLRSDHDDLLKETEKLKQEVLFLTDKLVVNDRQHLRNIVSENGSGPGGVVPVKSACNKQEDASSAGSDVLNSDSPHAGSSDVFGSEEEDDHNNIFSGSFLPAPSYLLELGDGHFQDPHPLGDQLCSFWS